MESKKDDSGALRERLEQTARDLTEHRQTHVVWRDWLQADPTREEVNPHAGSAEFHAGLIGDYDRHLANITEAIAALSPQGSEPAGVGDWVMVPRDATREMVQDAIDEAIGAGCDYISHAHMTAAYAAMIATAPAPAQQAVTVDDAMIERALTAPSPGVGMDLDYLCDCADMTKGERYALIRNALTAALNTTAQGASDA